MKAIMIDLCNSESACLQNLKTNLVDLATFWFSTPWKQLLVLWKEFLPELKKGSLSGVNIFFLPTLRFTVSKLHRMFTASSPKLTHHLPLSSFFICISCACHVTTYWLLNTVLVIALFPGLPYLRLLITYAKIEGEGLETYHVICGTADVMILDTTAHSHSYAHL